MRHLVSPESKVRPSYECNGLNTLLRFEPQPDSYGSILYDLWYVRMAAWPQPDYNLTEAAYILTMVTLSKPTKLPKPQYLLI